jgi:pentatricopeptide repeat protein
MHAQGLTPDAMSLNTVIKAFVRNGDSDGAQNWFNEMQESGDKPDAVSYNGQLQSLTELDFYGCSSLNSLPESIGQLQSLTKSSLNDCSSLTLLPESIGQL